MGAKRRFMFELDMHTHTVASGHAYSTIIENARIAKEKGLKLLGISDHAPALPGAVQLFYVSNLRILPDMIEGIRVLKGIEANIINYKGGIDLGKRDLSQLDYVIASLHIPCINPSSSKDNTNALIGAMKNPYVTMIGHPDDARYDKDYREIVKAAKYYDKLIEVNNSSLVPNGFRKNAKDEIIKYLEICEAEQVKIICNSDAHFAYDVGNFTNCERVLEEIGFPVHLVVNRSAEEYLARITSK